MKMALESGEVRMDVPSELANVVLSDEQGQPVKLGEAWKEKTAVVAWMRHFGCIFCREHVKEISARIDEIHGSGAELWVVSSGTPNFVRGFRELTGYQGKILVDPKLESYRAAKLNRGWKFSIKPSVAVNAVRAMARGNLQGAVQGDAAQQGGVMIVKPGGEVVFRHVSEAAGDNAEAGEIVRALQR